ncbi:unnamed protein product [Gongylonema pulchrum]|uniref:Calponin-homology (CH) domain-containing protein n=1 Tax=Gongylonema pulchrum TaxID=637853 RepID=A0A183DFL0_9BILA|nr:unnamed protein product [Gongylonema pulchrum]
MDRSWQDGVAFNALIHRVMPDLIDMNKTRRSSPRDNLEQAFRLAKMHLHIRPLLDEEDMLRDKPDKRSVITYVSQFIRTPTVLRPIEIGALIDDHALIAWMEATLNTLRSSLSAPLYDQYQVYTFLTGLRIGFF